MNGKLGRPYKVVYVAKGFVSGLTNIVAKVEKPNGAYVGLFPLIEDTDSFYAGTYYFNLVLSSSEQEGEYTVVIVEPTSTHREVLKVTMENPVNVDVTFNFEDFDVRGTVSLERNLKAKIMEQPMLRGVVKQQPLLSGKIINNSLVGKIVSTNQLKAKILMEC